jgi:hypothetical protein
VNLHFEFNTVVGPSYGIANLVRSSTDGQWRAFLLFTLLDGIHGHPEQVGPHRPRGTHNDTESYDVRRAEETELFHNSPSVLIGERSLVLPWQGGS